MSHRYCAKWNEYSIDLPSINFRKLLMAASEKNADAMLVLKSVSDLNLKKLSVCMPSPMEEKDNS